MRKAMTVILWLGLAVCAILTISLSGQKSALQRDAKDAERKTEVLQALYDQKKSEWQEKEAALTREKNDLLQKTKALTLERDILSEALDAARQESQAQRQTADALTAERETASGRLSEVLAMLLTPVPDLSASCAEAVEDGPDEARETPLPLPARGVQPVPFAE